MTKIKTDLRVLNLENIPRLDEDLKKAMLTLESLQKNLSAYLEEKQKFFPRFYFLPNEDLIEILGDS